jgi:nitrogen regulatory protein PII-like uncharacterized protein
MKIDRVRFFFRLGAGLAALAALSAAADAKAAAGSAKPVPIVVRVFEGNRFVPDLSLKDFAIEESDLPVSSEALFLVRKSTIERRDGRADIQPDLSRRIVLLFQLTEYDNKISGALEFLFLKELLPTDTLEIQTPMHNYKLTAAALAAKPRDVLARELTGILRKDIIEGGMAYNSALRDLKRSVRQIGRVGRTGLSDTEGEVDDGTSLEQQLMQYGEHLQQMESLRMVDENKLVSFAEGMKSLSGQKLVFFVYQREFRPEISPQTQDILVLNNQDRPDILAAVETLFSSYRRPINLNREPIIKAFADSGMYFNFLYMNREPERISGINMREQSEDVYKALSDAAEATGGVTDTSQNAAVSLASALMATESSYILYYTTSTAAPPGTFINLKVSVKGKDYRVVHRAGYFTGS